MQEKTRAWQSFTCTKHVRKNGHVDGTQLFHAGVFEQPCRPVGQRG